MKKKIIGILVVMVLAAGVIMPVVFAAPKVPNPFSDEYDIGTARTAQMENVGFHCASAGGNGRVWVEAYDVKAAAAKASGEKWVEETIIYIDDNSWLLANTTDYVCPVCGGTYWVSFSNKSGVPDGKNMQLTHYYPPSDEWEFLSGGGVSIVKTKYGEYTDWFALPGEFTFELFAIGENGAEEKVAEGETNFFGCVEFFNLEPGDYVVREKVAVDVKTIPNGSHGYRYVWKAIYPDGADGLYFTLDKDGKTFVGELETDQLAIDNVYYCKHAVQWTKAPDDAEYAWALSVGAVPFEITAGDRGYLWYGVCSGDGNVCRAHYVEATCTANAYIELWHDCIGTGSDGLPYDYSTGWNCYIPDTALGHDLAPWNPGGFKPFLYGYFAQYCTRTNDTRCCNTDFEMKYYEDEWVKAFVAEYGFNLNEVGGWNGTVWTCPWNSEWIVTKVS
ncbi:MAG: hypothetical protein FWD58_02950 [Firmicutes bacterium]|nr:hypothetical protein [Bacillota bacterium]